MLASSAVSLQAAVFSVTNVNDSGAGSLRQAINDLNLSVDPANTIEFSGLAGVAPVKINLATDLPEIYIPVTIDGYTQPNSQVNTATDGSTNAVPGVELCGNGFSLLRGLVLVSPADDSTIRGLVVNEFGSSGILVMANNAIIAGNFVGTDATGTLNKRNMAGIELDYGSGNRVGGTAIEDKNLVVGCYNFRGTKAAIPVFQSNNNVIEGNLIGTDKTGTVSLGLSSCGIFLNASSGNTIGGVTEASRNIISGNTNGLFGVLMLDDSDSNIVQNNYIGTDLTGSFALPNGRGVGVRVSSNNTISDNLISGNKFEGVLLGIEPTSEGIVNNVISTNKIGTDASGSSVVPNGRDGVVVQARLQDSVISGNLISGNKGNGVFIGGSSENTIIQGNYIGTDMNGVLPLGNGGNGIQLASLRNLTWNNTIGGATDAEKNVIAANKCHGVSIEYCSYDNLVQNNNIGSSVTGNALARPNAQAMGNCKDGVHLFCNSYNNTVEENLITYNKCYGVELNTQANKNTVQDNTIEHNRKDGVAVVDSSCNLIGGLQDGNVIRDNGGNGVAVVEKCGTAVDNAVVGNSFSGNAGQDVVLASVPCHKSCGGCK